jgi:cytochrome b
MSDNKKLIWDIPTRIFHWAIAITLGYSWYSMDVEYNLDHHFLSGFIALGLILFRIIWGIVGSRYARYGSFVYKPSEFFAYLKGFFKRDGGKYAGHNPMGALSVFALLIVILVQTGTGMFADDEYYYFAPLNDYVSGSTAGRITEFHGTNAKIMLGIVILHIVAILFYRLYKKEKLVLAMITGKKPDENNIYEAIPGSRLPAAIILALTVFAIVYGVVNYL